MFAFGLSIWLRGSVILFFAVIILTEFAPSLLLLFGAIDLLMALWTVHALRTA